MPDRLSGQELAQKLRLEKAGLKVLFTSGFSVAVNGGAWPGREGKNFLQQPFSAQKPAETVRACLKRNRSHLRTVLNRGLESPLNPQAGKPAPRGADILVCGSWRLSSRQFLSAQTHDSRTVRGCAQRNPVSVNGVDKSG